MLSDLTFMDGQVVYEERLREAEYTRRFLSSQRVSRLPRLVKTVLLIFV